jgi:hypothetical protein
VPVTREKASKRFELKPGEAWCTCGNCGRPLAKMLADGRLQRKWVDGWEYIIPTPSARVVISCGCRDPAYENVFMLNREPGTPKQAQ